MADRFLPKDVEGALAKREAIRAALLGDSTALAALIRSDVELDADFREDLAALIGGELYVPSPPVGAPGKSAADIIADLMTNDSSRALRRYHKVARWMRKRAGRFSLHQEAERLSDAIARHEGLDPEKFRTFRRRGEGAKWAALERAAAREFEQSDYRQKPHIK